MSTCPPSLLGLCLRHVLKEVWKISFVFHVLLETVSRAAFYRFLFEFWCVALAFDVVVVETVIFGACSMQKHRFQRSGVLVFYLNASATTIVSSYFNVRSLQWSKKSVLNSPGHHANITSAPANSILFDAVVDRRMFALNRLAAFRGSGGRSWG